MHLYTYYTNLFNSWLKKYVIFYVGLSYYFSVYKYEIYKHTCIDMRMSISKSAKNPQKIVKQFLSFKPIKCFLFSL